MAHALLLVGVADNQECLDAVLVVVLLERLMFGDAGADRFSDVWV